MSNRGEAGHRFDIASYRLADMIPGGHLLASTDPAGFLECVADKLAHAQETIDDLAHELLEKSERIAELEAANARYNELLMAVANKYEGETRHQTALRYIEERERGTGLCCGRKDAQKEVK